MLTAPKDTLPTRFKNPALFHITCLYSPILPGFGSFLLKVKKRLGNSVQISDFTWEGLVFKIVSIPVEHRNEVERIAEEAKVKISDGIPVIIDPDGEKWFPFGEKSIWNLESCHTYPLTGKDKDHALKADFDNLQAVGR